MIWQPSPGLNQANCFVSFLPSQLLPGPRPCPHIPLTPVPMGSDAVPLCLPDEGGNDLNLTLHASGFGVQRIENEQDQYPQVGLKDKDLNFTNVMF